MELWDVRAEGNILGGEQMYRCPQEAKHSAGKKQHRGRVLSRRFPQRATISPSHVTKDQETSTDEAALPNSTASTLHATGAVFVCSLTLVFTSADLRECQISGCPYTSHVFGVVQFIQRVE